jgi:hypothetical protein
MTEPLRPMSTGQLLDQAFALYRRNFLLFVGIATVGPAAYLVFQMLTVGANVGFPFSGRRATTPVAGASLGLSLLVGYVVMLAGMALSHAATVKAVAAVHLGREISVAGAYKALRGRIWSLFGTFGLIVLIVGAAVLVIGMIGGLILAGILVGRPASSAGGAVGRSIAVIVIAVVIFAVIIAIYVRYALAIQACMVEGLGPRASLKRSVFLSQGSRWRVVAIYLIFLILSWIVGAGLGAMGSAIGIRLHNRIAAAVLIYLAGFIAGALTGPLATIGLSLLYYDERVRKEAFDLQLMLLSLDVPGVPSATPAETTPAQI